MEEKKTKWYNRIEETVCNVFLGLMLIILFYQVIMRFVFHNTNAWSEELSRYLFVWFIYLSACVAIYKNAHIVIEACLNVWPKKLRFPIVILGNILFFIYALVVVYLSWGFCQSALAAGSYSTGLHIGMGYVYMCLPIGHFAMAIRLVQLTVKMIKNPENYPVG